MQLHLKLTIAMQLIGPDMEIGARTATHHNADAVEYEWTLRGRCNRIGWDWITELDRENPDSVYRHV